MDLACVKQGSFNRVLEGVFEEECVSFLRCERVRIAVFSCVISRVNYVSKNVFESERKRHKFDSRELIKPCKSFIYKALKGHPDENSIEHFLVLYDVFVA